MKNNSNLPNKIANKAKRVFLENENRPLFLCNWVDAVFMHYQVEIDDLHSEIPFELDLYDGRAYISLVAFTMEKFRFNLGGMLGQLLTLPFSVQKYFNIRTYVRHEKGNGIYFINEWISNRVCSVIGRLMYGRPIHFGHLSYSNRFESGKLRGALVYNHFNGYFKFQAKVDSKEDFHQFESDTLGDFLGERYIAYVKEHGKKKYFRIWHHPWSQIPIKLEKIEDGLLEKVGSWAKKLSFIGANYSPGVYGVWMGRPHTAY